MSLRQKLNENHRLAVGTGLVLIVLAIVFIFRQSGGASADGRPVNPQAYFTADDGATWFADRADRVPPFDHEGKPAVRAMVFRGADGKVFAGYLIRYNEQAKKRLEAKAGNSDSLRSSGIEVKKPGDPKWVPQNSMLGAKIASIKAPGSDAVPELVTP